MLAYPLKGFLLETGFLHRGINADMNLWQVYAKTHQCMADCEKN